MDQENRFFDQIWTEALELTAKKIGCSTKSAQLILSAQAHAGMAGISCAFVRTAQGQYSRIVVVGFCIENRERLLSCSRALTHQELPYCLKQRLAEAGGERLVLDLNARFFGLRKEKPRTNNTLEAT